MARGLRLVRGFTKRQNVEDSQVIVFVQETAVFCPMPFRPLPALGISTRAETVIFFSVQNKSSCLSILCLSFSSAFYRSFTGTRGKMSKRFFREERPTRWRIFTGRQIALA